MTEQKKLTNEQEYCKAQIDDLNKKAATLNFQLDQVKASLSVFTNLLAETTSDTASEVLKENKPKKEENKNDNN
jgi:uncharacterized coiled-coil protein SlyX